MVNNYFENIWKLHYEWGKNLFYTDIVSIVGGTVVLSKVPGSYYNFFIPATSDPLKINFSKVKETLSKNGSKFSLCLLEKYQKQGLEEFLIRNGYKFEGRDSWMGYDKTSYQDDQVHSTVVNVTPQIFDDYASVLDIVFGDFPGNPQYMDICRKTMSGEQVSTYLGLKSELFLIYENNQPAAGAGMFYSKEGNFAYLHDAGTLKKYRGHGYQSDLIKFRVNKATGIGINRIYSSVDHGEQSWTNSIRCGLNEMHTSLLFIEK